MKYSKDKKDYEDWKNIQISTQEKNKEHPLFKSLTKKKIKHQKTELRSNLGTQ